MTKREDIFVQVTLNSFAIQCNRFLSIFFYSFLIVWNKYSIFSSTHQDLQNSISRSEWFFLDFIYYRKIYQPPALIMIFAFSIMKLYAKLSIFSFSPLLNSCDFRIFFIDCTFYSHVISSPTSHMQCARSTDTHCSKAMLELYGDI